ncbi:Reverse transcriptase (RNA-dependent DNA polymerase) [Fragilaria crotonensis]|nr:Reverse transcriptase (RNA-dependent DNA polymerase) [Fragilaria crotonensis]
MLIDKIKADFLTPTKAQLEIELSRVPMTMTYEQALSLFRNMVNQKHPPQMGAAQNRVRRNINETNSGRGARGQSVRGGHGRGGRGGRSSRSGRGNVQKTRSDSRIITLTDGSQIEYHASFSFPRHVYMKFKQEDKDTLRRERAAYNEQRRNRNELQELRTQASDVPMQVSLPTDSVSVSQRTQVSQVTTGQSVMGGRNEQAQNRQNRRIAAVTTCRRVASATPLLRSAFNDPPTDTAAYNECDSNADTCCLGTNFVVLQSTYRTADVYAYDSSIKPIENVPIVTGATAYDDPTTGTTFILVFHESLYYGTALDHSLINPNQVRAYGIPLWDNPYDATHNLGIEVNEDLFIALHTAGTKIHFRTRVPSAQELQDCAHVQMTSSSPWDPTNLMMVQALHQGGTTMPAWQRPLPQLVPSFPPITEYLEATSNDALLHSIDPSLVRVGELLSKRLQQASEVDTTVYEHLDIPARRTFVSTERHAKVSAELLADRFGIGPKRAQRTLRVTTQRGMRSAILPIGRRYRADRVFGVKRLSGKFATDTAYGKLKSLRGNVGCQIYSHKCGFKVAYPLMKVDGNHVGDSLTQFISDFGVPAQLTFDGASVQTGPKTRFMDAIRRYEIKYHVSGPRRPNENPAEQSIHEIKKRWYRIMLKKKVPPRLWDYGFVWVCETENLCANFSNAIPISATTVQRLTNDERSTDEVKRQMSEYEDKVKTTFEARSSDIANTIRGVELSKIIDHENEDEGFYQEFTRVIDDAMLPHADDQVDNDDKFVEVETDQYIGMELALPRGDDGAMVHAKVIKRLKDNEGNPVGTVNANPLLDSRAYEVEFINGHVEELTANIIAENLIAQVDDEGHRQMMLEEILDHRTTREAIPKSQGTYVNQYGVKRQKQTTRGWELLIQWKDGSTDWVALKDFKESYPVELAQYAVDRAIDDEPAFAWWVSYVLKKQKRILQKIKTKSKYWSRTHKYGVCAKERQGGNGN